MVSSNLKIVNNDELINLRWTTPYGSIRFSFEDNNIINYIKINYSELNQNSVKKVHLYYIENNMFNYIGLIQDININNILNNSYNKKDYLLYFESNGLFNNTYSELEIPNIFIGFKNNINNVLENLTDKLLNIQIDNIINKYNVPVAHLDDNIINETYSLLLNNSKSSIIDIFLDEPISLKYYKNCRMYQIIQLILIIKHIIIIMNMAKLHQFNYLVQIILTLMMKLRLLMLDILV